MRVCRKILHFAYLVQLRTDSSGSNTESDMWILKERFLIVIFCSRPKSKILHPNWQFPEEAGEIFWVDINEYEYEFQQDKVF